MSLVDDSNPSVQYASGWIWDQGVAEVDATRHGANVAGLRAWLSFTGTGVSVVGTLGPSDKYGQPKTTYLIDGQVAGSYSAPLTPSGETRYNITFFSAHDLSPGDHIVLINNTDGTSPNTFWLDYFLIDTSPSSASGPSSPTVAPSPNTVSVSVQTVTSISGTATVVSTVSVTVPVKLQPDPTSAANTNSDSGAGSSHSKAGVIAAATISAVALLVFLGVAVWWLRRRRRSATTPGTVAPFTLSQDPFVSGHQPSMRYSTTTGATLPVSPAGSHFGHRPPTAPPSEVAPESVVSQPESYTPSASSGAGLLAPLRRTASPSSPPAPASYRPSPVSEKSQRSRSDPDTPSLAFSSAHGTGPASSYSQSGPQTPASPAFSSASGSAPLMSPAALPPGAWHAPPDSHGRAHTLLRSLFSRGNRAGPRSDVSAAPRDVDSGLRLYDDVVLPPPYTQE